MTSFIAFLFCFVFFVFLFCFVFKYPPKWCTALAWLVPHETAAVSAQVLCTPYNHAPCHFMQSHIRKVHACLAVTCHLHFWQNGQDLLRATAVTRGWNGYRNKSAQKVDPGEENSPAAPAGIRTRDLSITSPAL